MCMPESALDVGWHLVRQLALSGSDSAPPATAAASEAAPLVASAPRCCPHPAVASMSSRRIRRRMNNTQARNHRSIRHTEASMSLQ